MNTNERIAEYDRRTLRMHQLLSDMVADCELVAEFDDTVTISVDKEDYNEVMELLHNKEWI